MKKEEIAQLQAYFRRTFGNERMIVKARPQKNDSAEVFIGEDFIGVLFRDEDEGELSYNFSMAILEFDLEEGDE